MTFKNDRVSLNLLDLALNNSKHIQKHGLLQPACRPTMSPVTFSSPNSYIPIYTWKDYPKLRSFSLEFQTNEYYGILAYALGADVQQSAQSTNSKNYNHITSSTFPLSYKRDFFALEIHNRFLLAYFNLGSNYIRHEVVHEHVSSGKSHQISVELNDQYALFRFIFIVYFYLLE